MNKKLNTFLFIICATLLNVIIAVLGFLVLTILYIRFLMPAMPETVQSWIFSFIFISAIVISFVLYRIIFKYLQKKVDVEKYFDPIFSRRGAKK